MFWFLSLLRRVREKRIKVSAEWTDYYIYLKFLDKYKEIKSTVQIGKKNEHTEVNYIKGYDFPATMTIFISLWIVTMAKWSALLSTKKN